MDLFPANSPAAYEVLWCSEAQCGSLSSSSSPSGGSSSVSSPDLISQPYLAFDDFPLFPSEMKRSFSYEGDKHAAAPASKIPHNDVSQLPTAAQIIDKCRDNLGREETQVFLGGACNPTTWRHDIAIPMLEDYGVSYFNPQVKDWEPALIELEHQARENAEVLFYVIDNQTRCVVVMIEVAYFVAKKRNVVLVVQGFKEPGQRICNEPISSREYEDLTCAQMILQQLVERHGIPVFNDIHTALKCTAKMVKERIPLQDLKLTELAPVKNSKEVLHIGNKLINLRKTFESLDSKSNGEIRLSHIRTVYRILSNQELTKDKVAELMTGLSNCKEAQKPCQSEKSSAAKKKDVTNGLNGVMTLNFDQFCCLIFKLVSQLCQNQSQNLTSLIASKATDLFQSLSNALDHLLDHVPGNSPGWMPLTCKQENGTEAQSHSSSSYDVYLGGDYPPYSNWRQQLVIPFLRKHGLSYLNPNPHSNLSDSKESKLAVDSCKVILFNIHDSSRSLEFMTMAAYYLGLGCQVVVCIQYLPEDCQLNGEEKLSKLAVKDYNRGRSYLSDMANREGITVFSNMDDALKSILSLIKNNASSKDS